MSLDNEFLEKQRKRLLYRLRNKSELLRSHSEQALSHSQKDITMIEFAIKRMDQRQYGLCTNCGIPINKKRLESIPETPFCIVCAKNPYQ